MRYLRILLIIGSIFSFSENANATEDWLPPKSKEIGVMRVDTFGAGGASTKTYYASKWEVQAVVDFLEKKFGTKAEHKQGFFIIPSPSTVSDSSIAVYPKENLSLLTGFYVKKLPRGTRSIIID